jgi:hypothetical protein
MNTLFGARLAAVQSARSRHFGFQRLLLAATAIVLSGCMPATTTTRVQADPADPTAPVARAGYRSTIAPYSSLRPATPAPWRERNDSVTPQKPDR